MNFLTKEALIESINLIWLALSSTGSIFRIIKIVSIIAKKVERHKSYHQLMANFEKFRPKKSECMSFFSKFSMIRLGQTELE